MKPIPAVNFGHERTISLSVIICAHNPRPDYLRRTLDGIKAQTLPMEQWELMLIDNGSKEPLAPVWDLSWHPHARHIREEELGTVNARLRGVREFQGELLVFVDDDNVLKSDYLAVMANKLKDYPRIGCFGAGVLEPEFEQEPAPELRSHTACLALRTVTKPQWSNMMEDLIIPWGAGMGVRRVVAEKFAVDVQNSPIRKLLGRTGSNLNSCEDDEFAWIACELGLGKGLFPNLQVTHLIGRKRVEKNYLLSISEGNGFSQVLIAHIHQRPLVSTPQPSTFADILGSLFRGKPFAAIRHANSWWNYFDTPALEREFEDAWRAGVRRGQKVLAEMKRTKTYME